MKKLFILLTTITLPLLLLAQSQDYSRVKVFLGEKTIGQLAALGLDAEHGDYKPGEYFTSDFSDLEIQQIENAGFEYEVLIADVKAHYVRQNEEDIGATQRTVGDCSGVGFYDYYLPENFELGSMAGFLTYQEMLDNLDAMFDQYPNLITERAPIGNILTHEGRPIYWLRISDNPQVDEEEPEVFYNSLHHAREPNSLSQIIYFMWYLLERYDTDTEVQYLLENTELYFVPMVNPDGYIYNETNDPNGGGLWRKNKRDNNGDGSFDEAIDGVDLNRNYGYEWGFDDNGSSPNPGSAVYRGPSPFSEPELQNIRDFCNAHEFQIALNYHTYGNLLIYPWGYSDAEADPYFTVMTEALNRENEYFAGTTSETVGYAVNGVTDDWMYGETTTKPPIFSITPEVGYSVYGFWPPEAEIIRFCQSAVLQNLTTAHLVLNFGLATDLSDNILTDIDGSFEFEITRYGLMDGELDVQLLPVSDNIVATTIPQSFTLDPGQSMFSSFGYTLNADIAVGEPVQFALAVDNGVYTHSDTLTKTYGIPDNPDFEDDLTTNDNWANVGVSSEWGLRTSDYYSAPSCMADSPFGNYESGSENILELINPISLIDAESAELRFWAKWETERFRDYAQVQVSADAGQTWEPVCGLYTVAGTTFQDLGEPVYQGFQDDWVLEQMDLSEFVGQDILLRFLMKANNNFFTVDGFNFDDLTVTIFEGVMTEVQQLGEGDFSFSQNHPNPARDYTVIDLNRPVEGRLFVYNLLGQMVYSQQLDGIASQVVVPTVDWAAGVYTYRFEIDGKMGAAGKMAVQ